MSKKLDTILELWIAAVPIVILLVIVLFCGGGLWKWLKWCFG